MLELPQAFKPIIGITVAALLTALGTVCIHGGATVWIAVAAFLLSGFLADLLTSLAHFGFDYVFPYRMPVLGPIAREFREHHEEPTLDPSAYVVNFTKGSYGALLGAVVVLLLSAALPDTRTAFFVLATVTGVSLWAFFFHQIHSYAHMGSHLHPDEFNRRAREIARLRSKRERTQEFNLLFETVPIPPAVRRLQKWHLILDPGKHNLHHLGFESDFSSVNGWSDPLMNVVLGPVARRYKASQV